jgi:hypothetical protein
MDLHDDFVIENSECGPTMVCRVCDDWVYIEDLSLADLIESAKEHTHKRKAPTT